MENLCVFIENITTKEVVWHVALGLGIIFLLSGCLYLIGKDLNREIYYIQAAIIEAVGNFILYIPNVYYNELKDCPMSGYKIFETFVTTMLKTIEVYLSMGYERIEFGEYVVFSSIYNSVRIVIHLVMIVFTGQFIIKFFDGPLQKFKLNSISKNKTTYIFKECNSKTIAIAKSIKEDAGQTGKNNLIFSCRAKTGFEKEVASIGGIYVDYSILQIVKIIKNKANTIELFLFDDNEADNLIELKSICDELKNNTNEIKVYVELTNIPWQFYDGFTEPYNKQNSKLTINFVRTDENFVYYQLLKNSIFENAKKCDTHKEIKVLIVGEVIGKNLEMLKTLLHLGQMPGYKLFIKVIEDKHDKKKLCQLMPEVYEKIEEEGNAIYELSINEGVPYYSNELLDIIQNEYSDFTFAYINTGDDVCNIDISVQIQSLCYRLLRKPSDYKIQVNVENPKMCSNWNNQLFDMINIVGGIDELYKYNFISMTEIEQASEKIHCIRQDNKLKEKQSELAALELLKKEATGMEAEKIIQEINVIEKEIAKLPISWKEYSNNEYNRHQVYARTLSLKFRVWVANQLYTNVSDEQLCEIFSQNILDESGNETNPWKIYEHMRWNMYTRTLGYRRDETYLSEKTDKLEKKERDKTLVHDDLISFKKLPQKTQTKDSIQLNVEILKILKEL